LDEFYPGFALALGVDFLFPLVDEHFSLCIDLLKKGAFGLYGRLFHPSDLLGACWKFLPLPLGIIPSYHLYLNAADSILTSSSASICPFPVSVITARWSTAIANASSFKGFSQM
jgi:hypothetical protein